MQDENDADYGRMNFIERLRVRVFLFLIGMWRRMTLGARVMIIDGQKVLLVRHTYVPGWQFPGGGVDPGESARAAAMREAEEEAGLMLQGEVELHGIFYNGAPSRRDHIAFFIARGHEKVRATEANFEIHDAEWFDINALPQDINPGALRRIQEIFQDQPISENW